MSVGHIYRYFTGKEAIIAAIVREHTDEVLSKVSDLPLNAQDLRQVMVERAYAGLASVTDPEKASLMIEIRAEGARNPAIGALARQAEAEIIAQVRKAVAVAVGRSLTAADLEARAQMFSVIFHGVEMQTAIDPAIDRQALARVAQLAIDAILR